MKAGPRSGWLRPTLFVAATAVIVAVIAFAGSETRLRLEHDLLTRLRQNEPVVTVDIEGVGEIPMYLNPEDQVITPAMLRERYWEPKETLWFTRSLLKGDTVVDIGANVGYYTLIASKLVGDEGRVVAFEPDPVSFALLEKNVKLNGLSNVVLEQKAVSNEPGTLQLYIAPENKGDHRIYQPSDEEREYVEVEAVMLDDYFADDPRPIDFVKIDTQGAEVAILLSMKRILSGNPDLRLVVEFWPWGLSDFGFRAQQLLAILETGRFRFFNLNGARESGLLEIKPERLLSRYTDANREFTNLLAVRGKEALDTLRSQGAGVYP